MQQQLEQHGVDHQVALTTQGPSDTFKLKPKSQLKAEKSSFAPRACSLHSVVNAAVVLGMYSPQRLKSVESAFKRVFAGERWCQQGVKGLSEPQRLSEGPLASLKQVIGS